MGGGGGGDWAGERQSTSALPTLAHIWRAVDFLGRPRRVCGGCCFQAQGPPFPILTGDLNVRRIGRRELPRSDTNSLWKRLAGPPGQRGGLQGSDAE